MDILYKNIKYLRTNLKLSQQELALRTGYTDRSSIAKIEAGDVDLTRSKIVVFAKALNVSVRELMDIDIEEWNIEASRFDASVIALEYQLKAQGWNFSILPEEGMFLLSNENISVRITSEDYTFLSEQSQKTLQKNIALIINNQEKQITPTTVNLKAYKSINDVYQELNIQNRDKALRYATALLETQEGDAILQNTVLQREKQA